MNDKAYSCQQRAPRKDGDATRAHILQTAGQLFAERGYTDTTSKMICAEAQINIAAVNYHFGSHGDLYMAVLREVHAHLLNLDYLTAIANSPVSPRDKLGCLIEGLVTDLIDHHSWHTRLWARELLSPSPYAVAIVQDEALPKFGIIKRIISDMTGLPVDSPPLLRCLLCVMSPCMMLLIVNRDLETPLSDLYSHPSSAVVAQIKTFVFAGLDAVLAGQESEPTLKPIPDTKNNHG